MSKAGSRRRRRARRRRRLIVAGVFLTLALAFAGLGAWAVFRHRPQVTVRNYPVLYEELIRAYAAENELSPAYVAAVILAESSYRPDAKSSANAQGLMQMLPSTAPEVAEKLGETYVEDSLFDPEVSIRYGCKYLGDLMKRFDGDMRLASAAYHAGARRVSEWLQNPDYSADGRTLDVIPYDSTNTYVQRLLKYYEKYKPLYGEA